MSNEESDSVAAPQRRRLLRSAAISIPLVVLLLVAALAFALPRLIQNEKFDRVLRDAAAGALGAPVEWKRIDVRIFPPRLTIDSPALTNQGPDRDQSKLAADSIDLQVAWLPLLQRRVQIDSLILRGVEIVGTRTDAGLQLPTDAMSNPPADAPAELPAENEAGLELAIRRLVVKDGRIVLRDLTRATPTIWNLEAVDFVAQGDRLDEPLTIQASARLRADTVEVGSLQAKGMLSLAGIYDLTLDLDGVALEPLTGFVDGLEARGLASGRVAVAGESQRLRTANIDLQVPALALSISGVDLQGDLKLTAKTVADAPISFAGVFSTRGKRRLAFEGTRDQENAIELAADLEAFELAPFRSLLPTGVGAEGAATGRIEVSRTAAGELQKGSAEIQIPSLRVARDDLEWSGALALVSGFEGDAPVAIDLGLSPVGGGRVGAIGTSTRDAILDLSLSFEQFDLSALQSFLPKSTNTANALAGRATGRGRVVGPAATPDVIKLDLDLKQASVRLADLALNGPFRVVLDAQEPLTERLRGQLDLDLTAAAFAYGQSFKKQAGERAQAAIRFSPQAADQTRFESVIKLRQLESIALDGHFGKSTSVILTTPTFDLEGWSETVPALASYAPKGSIAFQQFRIEPSEGKPSRLAGRIDLVGLSVQVADAGRLELRGQLVGEGRGLRAKDLTARSKGLNLGVTGTIDDPFGEIRYQLALQTIQETEANELVSAWTSVKDTLFGNFALDAQVSGIAGGASSFVDALDGKLALSIGKGRGGRLRGASLLRRVLDQIPLLGGATRFAQRFSGGRSVADYFREDFEIIEGDFELKNGVVNARKLRLVYDGYEANLVGTLRVDNLGIDMRGDLLLKSDLVHLLTGITGSQVAGREPLSIPLARVTQTLTDPKVSMTSATLAAVPRALLRTKAIEEPLRQGVQDLLGRVLRGGNSPAPAETQERAPSPTPSESNPAPAPVSPPAPSPAPTPTPAPAPAPTTVPPKPTTPVATPEETAPPVPAEPIAPSEPVVVPKTSVPAAPPIAPDAGAAPTPPIASEPKATPGIPPSE